MLPTLHRLSAILFSVFGLTFAIAYVLFRNEIAGAWPLWWLQVADPPLLLTGLTYGSTSIEQSLQQPSAPSRLLSSIIFIPAGLLFLLFATLNFWPLLYS
ncbi:hypothetical protein HYT95_03735 [Candidatus Peregrinibacteria bacterium]|nr:hypothetical protein [Candidatus Peregrinibacteria bacterium]